VVVGGEAPFPGGGNSLSGGRVGYRRCSYMILASDVCVDLLNVRRERLVLCFLALTAPRHCRLVCCFDGRVPGTCNVRGWQEPASWMLTEFACSRIKSVVKVEHSGGRVILDATRYLRVF